MNNNTNWNQQPPQNYHPAGNNGNSNAGRLLPQYPQRQQMPQQYPPAMPPHRPPPPYSPMPPYQQQAGPPPQPQGWVANTMQVVRQWSGQMRKVPVSQPPLVRYHPGQRALPVEQKAKPWKRSLTMRISMQMRRRRARWQNNQLNPSNILRNIAIAFGLFLVILFSSGAASAYAYYQSEFPRIQSIANRQISQTTHIYDRNGVLLYDLFDPNGGGRRTPVTYQDIPQVMRDAMVAAEDKTFWDNPGIDAQAILRAGIQYLQHNDQVVSGASTITQQVIKNLTNDRQVNLARKITEATLAVGLTQQYPKWKILEIYFNLSPFGAQELGVESATEDYFHLAPHCNAQHVCTPAIANLDLNAQGKHDPLLGLARASLLAGMPQNPSNYDPTISQSNRQLALQRQDFVLNQMLIMGIQVQGLGPITPEIIQQAEALTAKMTFTLYIHHVQAPNFVLQWLIPQLESQLGVDTLLNGGFNIRTTLDINLEQFVENAVRRHLDKPEYQPFVGDYGPLNTVHNVNDSAVVVMSAKTGEILAMDGGADWNSKDPRVGGQNNVAIAFRSPGSSFKPIVYAAAFQMGWYPGLVVPDQKTYYPFPSDGNTQLDVNNPVKTAYSPTDYGGGYHNLKSTIRIDMADSFNVPAVKAFEFAGQDNVLNMAHRLGITALDDKTHNPYVGPSAALGANGVPLIQMVGAYQVFANNGVRISPKSILDIWDNYGHNLYHFDPNNPGGVQVITPQLAYLMTSILSDEPARAIEFTGDHVLSFYDWQQATGQTHEVAAKTGTTDNFVDNWTIGYTPDVVVGVWSGNANNEQFSGHVVGITGAGPIWHSVIERASGACNIDGAGIPCGNYHPPYPFTQTTFTVPPGVVKQAISKSNGLEGTGNIDWLLDSEVPKQTGIPVPCNSTDTTQIPTPSPTTTFCTGPGIGTGNGTPTPVTVPGLGPTPTSTP